MAVPTLDEPPWFKLVSVAGAVMPVVGCDIQDVPFGSLAGGAPAWSADLEVVSPLYFSRNRRDHPLPDPVLMLRSALDR
jgi:CRISPR-associated endoribonuclease Cas6